MGLYGGLDVDDIHTRKELEVGQKILDYMGSTELIANLSEYRKQRKNLEKITYKEQKKQQVFTIMSEKKLEQQ